MIRLCAVSYLNTKPFLEGLERFFTQKELQIQTLIPSQCARSFIDGGTDVALVPVGSLLELKDVFLIDRFCIGAEGKVDSVFLFSNEPIENITTVYLDHHSRTSNGLTKILFRHHWKKDILYLQDSDYFNLIDGNRAGVIIGDRAIVMKDKYRYCYDLASEWQAWTGLPFAFAVWVYRSEKVGAELLNRLESAFDWGINHLSATAGKWASEFMMTEERAYFYLSECINYYFDEPKRQAFSRYLDCLAEIEGCERPKVYFRERINS